MRTTAKIFDALHPGVDYEPRIADEVTAESSGRCRQIHGSFRLEFRGIRADMRIESAKVRTPPQAFAGESELLKPENQPATGPDVSEVRRKPRFKLAVNISIHSPSCGLLKGSTLDISEIGVGAVLGEDVPVGEIVKLNIPLPSGPLTICATVRQRSAFFRYGFEFIEPNSVREILESACRQLALQQSASGRP